VNIPHTGAPTMALYVLMTLVAALVVYLFYAVIHPEKF
jgi:K+-transporting ATPase KdpF subunit